MQPNAPPRPARSKTGCLTCRRRKVRCDEQRPRCSHCERLNYECQWRPSQTTPQWKFVIGSTPRGECSTTTTNITTRPPSAEYPNHSGDGSAHQRTIDVDQILGYANFMWDTSSMLGYLSPGQSSQFSGPSADTGLMGSSVTMSDRSTGTNALASRATNIPKPQNGFHRPVEGFSHKSAASRSEPSPPQSPDDHHLIGYFVQSIVPPILAEVEPRKRWSSMRELIISMTNSSTMVRYAVLAFSSLMYCRREAPWLSSPNHYYHTALEELLSSSEADSSIPVSVRQYVLTAIFFLCYVDILEDRVENAHSHLRRAHKIFREGKSYDFRPSEIRILSWIRLLDARTVPAGGDGLFLSESDENLITQPSPSSISDVEHSEQGLDEVKQWDVEDALFQTLYQPGVIFFQRVQSFMGRISKIDPWNRSRGTVEDETEVVHIACQISKDLKDLYDHRPVLMDHAVKGSLTPPHVSASLAAAITRAFRTYLSNYYSSKIHLHRVAYKHLPLSRESTEALSQIRELSKHLVRDLEQGEVLPVSQLWPLLMLGSEEQDSSEREWIRTQILHMEKVATNARVTAHVLQEVQARQDATKMRVNIRSVMHEVFDSCFAVI